MLDPHTFGNSRVSINLCAILNELDKPRITAKVTCYLSQRFHTINVIAESIKDPQIKSCIFNLMRRDIDRECALLIPEKVKTHMLNTLLVHMRDRLLRNKLRRVKLNAKI